MISVYLLLDLGVKGKGPCVCLFPISFTCLLLLGAELRRGHAQVLFHVFREEGDIREIEEEGDLLDALAQARRASLSKCFCRTV